MGSRPAASRTPFVSEPDLRAQLESLGLGWRTVSGAVAVAKIVHGSQRRDDGNPYLEEHVFPVALETARCVVNWAVDPPEAAVVVALLHDVLEESEQVTVSELERTFGSDISAAVKLLTKPKRPTTNEGADNADPDREEIYMQRLASGPLVVRLVKVFDRLNNLACIHKSPSDKRSVYIDETRRFHLPLARAIDTGLAKAMEVRIRDLMRIESGR